MPDYRSTSQVAAPADRLFRYVSDVGHLPEYFPRMTSARLAEDGRAVDVTAQVDGREVQGQAWFEVDESNRSIAWGSEGPNDYHGTLTVEGDQGSDECRVVVTLTTTRAAGEEIQQGLEDTVEQLRRIAERG